MHLHMYYATYYFLPYEGILIEETRQLASYYGIKTLVFPLDITAWMIYNYGGWFML